MKYGRIDGMKYRGIDGKHFEAAAVSSTECGGQLQKFKVLGVRIF
jgi:hypothetical protein